MMYLDANFFIFALLDKTKKGDTARSIQRQIQEGKKPACTSALALDEVMWVLIKNKRRNLLRKAIEGIYSLNNLKIGEVSSMIPLRALDFIDTYSLKPRDAFHLAVMDELHISEIVSNDSDFDKVKSVRRINF